MHQDALHADTALPGLVEGADQHALSSARVMPTCAMMGQAAGLTAALATRAAGNPRALDFADIRKRLESYGADLDVAQ